MGPKLVNCCRPEQMGTKEFGKWMKRIQILEEGRVPAKVSEKRRRIARKEYRRLLKKLKFMVQWRKQGCRIWQRKKS